MSKIIKARAKLSSLSLDKRLLISLIKNSTTTTKNILVLISLILVKRLDNQTKRGLSKLSPLFCFGFIY